MPLPDPDAPTVLGPPGAPGAPATLDGLEVALRRLPTTALGGHRVLGLLGRGGMGAVFRAEHAATGAPRALKVVTTFDGDPERFAREAHAMAAVGGHPNVLKIHAAGAAPGLLWYAMDLAEGGDLEGRLRAGPLPPLEVARLGAALARGLAHVHAQGVLHRDLKPGNVLFDAGGAPRLVDFGLAWVAGAARLTATGTVVGTPLYMAPEQVVADPGGLDARADVYGLGAVLYEAATGQPPVDGSSAVEVMTRVVHAPPVPPRQLAPAIPRGLEAVLLRCLEKAPARRYPSAAALADDLEAVAAGRRPAALPSPWGGPVPALAGAALVAVLAAGGAVAARARPALPPPVPAPAPSSGDGAGAPTPPADDLAAGAVARAVEARRAEALARLADEDEAGALLALEVAWGAASADGPGVAPGARPEALASLEAPLLAALLLAGDAADDGPGGPGPAGPGAPWAARGGPAAAAARAAEGFARPGGPRLRLAGAAGVQDGLAAAAAELARFRRSVSAEGTAAVVAELERLVAAAEATPPADVVGAALRVRAQRAVVDADGALLRAARGGVAARALALVERARRLAEGSRAAAALAVVERALARRAGADAPRPAVEPARLAGRYDRQRVALHALRLLAADPAAPDEVEAGLADGRAIVEVGRPLGLVDPGGGLEVEVPFERGPLVDLLVSAFQARLELLLWQAWHARADRRAAALRAAALDAAEAMARAEPEAAALCVARAHLLGGDVPAARAALDRAPGDRGPRDWPRRLLEAEADLLAGDAAGAERRLAALEAALGAELVAARREVALARAAAAAAAGDAVTAGARLDAVAAELGARGPWRDADDRGQRPVAPWRTLSATARQVEAARRGWRPDVARRPWSD